MLQKKSWHLFKSLSHPLSIVISKSLSVFGKAFEFYKLFILKII
jgi:hypothetical protein